MPERTWSVDLTWDEITALGVVCVSPQAVAETIFWDNWDPCLSEAQLEARREHLAGNLTSILDKIRAQTPLGAQNRPKST